MSLQEKINLLSDDKVMNMSDQDILSFCLSDGENKIIEKYDDKNELTKNLINHRTIGQNIPTLDRSCAGLGKSFMYESLMNSGMLDNQNKIIVLSENVQIPWEDIIKDNI